MQANDKGIDMSKRLGWLAAAAWALAGASYAQQIAPLPPAIPAPLDIPYPAGPITIDVDATNTAQGIFTIHEVAPVSDPYTMVGLAKSTSEFDLFYNKNGFETRLAWKHHSKFTVAPTWVGTTLKELAPEDILDASVSYDWADRYSIRLQGHNLTNERGLFSSDNIAQNLSNDGGYQVYGRSYLLDFAVKF